MRHFVFTFIYILFLAGCTAITQPQQPQKPDVDKSPIKIILDQSTGNYNDDNRAGSPLIFSKATKQPDVEVYYYAYNGEINILCSNSRLTEITIIDPQGREVASPIINASPNASTTITVPNTMYSYRIIVHSENFHGEGYIPSQISRHSGVKQDE